MQENDSTRTVIMRSLPPGSVCKRQGIQGDEYWIHRKTTKGCPPKCRGWLWGSFARAWMSTASHGVCAMDVIGVDDLSKEMANAIPLRAAELLWPLDVKRWNR